MGLGSRGRYIGWSLVVTALCDAVVEKVLPRVHLCISHVMVNCEVPLVVKIAWKARSVDGPFNEIGVDQVTFKIGRYKSMKPCGRLERKVDRVSNTSVVVGSIPR